MTPRQQSWSVHGLAALAIVCATVLGALRVLEAGAVSAIILGALTGIGLYHAPSPSSTAGLPTSMLVLLLLGAPACKAGSSWYWESGSSAPAVPEAPSAYATSITPITSLAGASSGLLYSGSAYLVDCTVSGTVTLYPVVHNGTAWEGPYQSYGCALDASVATQGTCIFPARQGSGLTWNAFKTGTGSVSSCTAEGLAGPVPSTPRGSGGSSGGGTVTSVGLALPAEFVVSGSPVMTSGTLTGAWASEAANTGLFGPTAGGSATPAFRALVAADLPNTAITPATYGSATQVAVCTFDQQGRATSCTNTTISGTAPGGAAGGALTGTYPNPMLASVVSGDTCAYPASITYNNGGQTTACTAGSAPPGPSVTPATDVTAGSGGSTGTSLLYARADHEHGLSPLTLRSVGTILNGDMSFNNNKIIQLKDGAAATDAATFGQLVNQVVNGFATGAIGAVTAYLGAPGTAVSATEIVIAKAPRAGTARNFYCDLGTAPGGADSVAFTVRTNLTTNTALTCSVSGAGTSCSDAAHTFAVSIGDDFSIKAVSSGILAARPSCAFEITAS